MSLGFCFGLLWFLSSTGTGGSVWCSSKAKRVSKALRGPKSQERGRLELQTPSCPSILLKQVAHLSHTGLCSSLALAMLQVWVPEPVVWNGQRKFWFVAEELLAHLHSTMRVRTALSPRWKVSFIHFTLPVFSFCLKNETLTLYFSLFRCWMLSSYPSYPMRALAVLQDQTVIDGNYRTQQERCVAQTPNSTYVPHSLSLDLAPMNSQQICCKQIKSLRNQSYQW